ncbi:MAG: 4'-phosphopantetheinyl transferase superfamily protein [Lewinellaceae bacterium]|nr:4'-phosphopantetheinyl transferase superfamily protein [Phaeodactylibacter sp.]MCB9037696.1 4'-phosphopantetheinyl transferase superfamily protein [Lewinellaceae bacterium]
MVFILHAKVEKQLEEAQFEAFLKRLPADIRQRIRRYRRWQDAHACLMGKLLLIEGLNRLGLDGAALIHELQYTAHGRPYLPGPIDFNISHSGEYVLCAISERCRVGVDIEKVKPIGLPDFRGQMTEAEWATVTTAADPIQAFYSYWTRKEAAIKAHGHGLSLPLKEVILGEGEVLMERTAWPLYEVRLAPGYVCHLVTDARVEQEDIRVEEVTF